MTAKLRNETGLIEDAKLPPMGHIVECHMFDGQTLYAHRRESFQPNCGWMWETATGWLVAGHPLLMEWHEIGENGMR